MSVQCWLILRNSIFDLRDRKEIITSKSINQRACVLRHVSGESESSSAGQWKQKQRETVSEYIYIRCNTQVSYRRESWL